MQTEVGPVYETPRARVSGTRYGARRSPVTTHRRSNISPSIVARSTDTYVVLSHNLAKSRMRNPALTSVGRSLKAAPKKKRSVRRAKTTRGRSLGRKRRVARKTLY